MTEDDEPTDTDAYWGGYTEHGKQLHLACTTKGEFARSACGLLLTGGAWVIPSQMWSERCRKCIAAELTERTPA